MADQAKPTDESHDAQSRKTNEMPEGKGSGMDSGGMKPEGTGTGTVPPLDEPGGTTTEEE